MPEEKDKLSEQEIEELAVELLKTFDAPECTNDPYMSPMLATPEMLTGLPPIHLVVRLVMIVCICVCVVYCNACLY